MNRLSLALASTALVVAVLGSTPVGGAAERGLATIVPYARQAGTATVAKNALRLNGHRSSTKGAPGTIPVVGANGKLAAALLTAPVQGAGAAGPAGPQGATGAQGPTGPTGPQGPAGVVNALTNTAELDSCCMAMSSVSGGAPVTTLALPAGRWVIFGKVHANDEPGSTPHKTQYSAICSLVAGTDVDFGEVQGLSSTIIGGVGAGSMITMNVIHEFTTPGTVALNCFSPASAPAGWTDARITAIQVASTAKPTVAPGKVSTSGGVSSK